MQATLNLAPAIVRATTRVAGVLKYLAVIVFGVLTLNELILAIAIPPYGAATDSSIHYGHLGLFFAGVVMTLIAGFFASYEADTGD